MARRKGIKMMKLAFGFVSGVGLVSGAIALSNIEEAGNLSGKLVPKAFAASVSWSGTDSNNNTKRNGIPPLSVQWDFNWDRREPDSLVKTEVDGKLSNEELKHLKPTATRHLFLIRHGHYFTAGAEDSQRKLTPKGSKQAHLTGQRLAELNYPYTAMYNSTMTRAIETADIIAKHLPQVPREECSMLREGAPIRPEPPVGHWKPELKIGDPRNPACVMFGCPQRCSEEQPTIVIQQFYEDGARIEAAFRKYFHRADVDQETDSYDVLVCHANVIRYFVCRALQFPPEAWLRMSLHHGSITWLSIRPSGRVALRALGDAGHIPPDDLSVS